MNSQQSMLIQQSFGHLLSKQRGGGATDNKANSSNNYLQLVRNGILLYLQQKSMEYLVNPASVCHNGTITVVASEMWDFLVTSHPCLLDSQYRACILKKEVTDAILELSHCLPMPTFSLHYDIKRGRKNEQQQHNSALLKRKKEILSSNECLVMKELVSSPIIQQEKKKLKSDPSMCNTEAANLLVSNVFWNDVANQLSVQKKEKNKQQRQAAALQQRKTRATTTSYTQTANGYYCMPVEECNQLKNMLETFLTGPSMLLEQSKDSDNGCADHYFQEESADFSIVQTNAPVMMGNQEQEQLIDLSTEQLSYTDLMGEYEEGPSMLCEVEAEVDPSCKFDQLFEQTIQHSMEEEQLQIRIITQTISPVEASYASSTEYLSVPSPMQSVWNQSASEDYSPYCRHVLQLTP